MTNINNQPHNNQDDNNNENNNNSSYYHTINKAKHVNHDNSSKQLI